VEVPKPVATNVGGKVEIIRARGVRLMMPVHMSVSGYGKYIYCDVPRPLETSFFYHSCDYHKVVVVWE